MTIVLDGSAGITNDGGYTGDGVVFADTTPANTLVTTTGGNVGIGTSSPGGKLDIVGTGTQNVNIRATTSGDAVLYLEASGVNAGEMGYSRSGQALYFKNGGSERARIDSSGNLLVGTTSTISQSATSGRGYMINWALSAVIQNMDSTPEGISYNYTTFTSGTVYPIVFRTGGTVRGFISSDGSTVTYASISDHRLKENVFPMQNALATVAALKPVTYKWKTNGADGQGFIAHELAEVVPDCVTGEKDAVDAEGNPVYQGIDTSFLVATLTAAIQEQQAIILAQESALNALTARVAALEGTQP